MRLGSGRIAAMLDLEMLTKAGVVPHSETTPDEDMPRRPGFAVSKELGGRLLLSYIRNRDVRLRARTGPVLLDATRRCVYTTPTPYSPHELVSALTLPLPSLPRTHVLLLEPARIAVVQGPRRTRYGAGVEYLLPEDYPVEALEIRWEIEIG